MVTMKHVDMLYVLAVLSSISSKQTENVKHFSFLKELWNSLEQQIETVYDMTQGV